MARSWSPDRAVTLRSSLQHPPPPGPSPPGCSPGQTAGGQPPVRRAPALTCPQGAGSEHFSTQAQGPQTPAGKGLFPQGGPPAVRQPPNRKSSCEPLVRLQLLSSAPVAGVKGPSTEVEKPLGFSEDLPFWRGQSWKKPITLECEKGQKQRPAWSFLPSRHFLLLSAIPPSAAKTRDSPTPQRAHGASPCDTP